MILALLFKHLPFSITKAGFDDDAKDGESELNLLKEKISPGKKAALKVSTRNQRIHILWSTGWMGIGAKTQLPTQ